MKGFIQIRLELQLQCFSMVSYPGLVSTNCYYYYTVPSISSLEAQSTTSDSITLSWTIPEGVSIDNYTLTVTRLCDNVVFPPTTGINGSFTTLPINGLSSGLQYTVGVIPLNILGTGMKSSLNATVMEGTGEILLLYSYLTLYIVNIIVQILPVVLLCY